MPRVTVYAAPMEKTSPRFCRAFAAGAQGAYSEIPQLQPGAAALFGSPRLWDLVVAARAEGRDLYYGDHGYFGRKEYYRVTRGDFQAGEFARAGGEERLDRLGVQIQPSRRGGRHILVCPPSPIYAELMRRAGVPIAETADWGAWAARELARFTDRPVRTRAKDSALKAGRSLAEDLEDCHAVVVFTSNVALEASMAGVPVFVLGPAASRVLGRRELSQIENPVYPDADQRRAVAASLASQQWTLAEIDAGDCWRALS